MPFDIRMPALSPTMEKGNLSRWLKKEGDTVKAGDVLAEIETDKATMEVEAADEGVLARILVPGGTADVPVNDVIGVIAGEGDDTEKIARMPEAAPRPPGASASGAPKTQVAPAASEPPKPRAEPAAPQSVPHGEASPRRRLFVSPLARRLAKGKGLDLASVHGSGPRGRIIERDVRAALARPASASAAQAAFAPALEDESVKKLFEPGSFEEVPHDPVRKIIARRLTDAVRTIPHFYLTAECNLDALLALRQAINEAAPRNNEGAPAYKISINDFLIKALAIALIRVPSANVTWADGAMLKHRRADVGVAVAIQGGLITPVVRAADSKSLSVISNEVRNLSSRARARKLKPEEYQGGSAAVSNLGMYGVKSFSAIINPPQATILAAGAAESRIIAKNGAPAVATMMSVTLSCDHRVVDGVLGAELLAAFRELMEKPAAMLV